jgi:hypothetical protein
MDDELVERDEKEQYKINAPSSMYKHLAQMRDTDEEIGMFCIALYGACEGYFMLTMG